MTLIYEIMIKILNSKSVIMWECRNSKKFFQKVTHQTDEFKNTVPRTLIKEDLNAEENLGLF